MKKQLIGIIVAVVVHLSAISLSAQDLKTEAQNKISTLETLMTQAENEGLDITREKTVVWFANSFLTFADWDAANVSKNTEIFSTYWPLRNEAAATAQNLADFERQEVIDMLNDAIQTLTAVINGDITRKDAVAIDWANITVDGDLVMNNGKPVFLYDYFSKTPEIAVGNTDLFNDHLGNIYKAWSINPAYCKDDYTLQPWQVSQLMNGSDQNMGYNMLWHYPTPGWAKAIEPEINKGRSIFIDYDIDNPVMKQVWETILPQIGEQIKNRKNNKLSICLANEPHWFSEEGHWSASANEMQSISSYTLAKFRTWLAEKHNNDIASLNSLWGKSYASFDAVQITIPIARSKRGTPEYYDWCRFNMDRGTAWIKFLHTKLKEGYPEARTHVKVMPDMFTEEDRHHGIDLEAITEMTEFIGNDAKSRKVNNNGSGSTEWEEHYSYFWEELAVSYDFMESVSPNKPHINSEVHFLSTGIFRELEMSRDYVRNAYWLATLHGMDIGLTWYWCRNPDGTPEERLMGATANDVSAGYNSSVNHQPRVANELTQTMIDLNAFSEEIIKLRKLRRPIRLFFTETSAINKDAHMHDQFELYESLYFQGLPMGYVTQKILNKQDKSNWDVVVVYKTEFATDKDFEALQEHLNNGGTVIIDEGRSLSKNEYGQPRSEQLEQGSGTLIEMGSSATFEAIKDKALDIIQGKGSTAEIQLRETNGLSKPGCTWRVTSNGDGSYLMTIVNLGKNEAILKPLVVGNNKVANCTDMLTGKQLGSSFTLKPEGVLLVRAEEGAEILGVEDKIEGDNIYAIGGEGVITIVNACDKEVSVSNVLGQRILQKKITDDTTVLPSPKGIMLVRIGNVKTVKVLVH